MKNAFILFVISLFCFTLFSYDCLAADSSFQAYDILSAHVDIVVSENKDINVAETIYVLNPKVLNPCFTYTIPLMTEHYTYTLSNVFVTDLSNQPAKFSTYTHIPNKEFYVNIFPVTNDGLVYVVHYTLTPRSNQSSDFDHLLINLKNNSQAYTYNELSFSITMPKPFSPSMVQLVPEKYGNTLSSSLIKYNIKDSMITGSMSSKGANRNIAFSMTLPVHYFSRPSHSPLFAPIVVFFLITAILIAVFLLHLKCKSNLASHQYILMKPMPSNLLNPAELSYLLGKHSNEAIISLIFYWASKGYIEIENTKNTIILKQLKIFDDGKRYEKDLFRSLFNQSNINGVIDLSALKGHFYNDISLAKDEVRGYMNTNINAFNYFPRNLSYIFMGLSVLLFFIFIPLINMMYVSFIQSDLFVIFYLRFYGIMLLYLMIILGILREGYFSTIRNKMFYWSIVIPFSLMVYASFNRLFISHATWVFIVYAMLIAIFTISFDNLFIYDHAKSLYSDSVGFKQFLKSAQKEDLQAILRTHPTYIFDMLPYVFALNIKKPSAMNYESLNFTCPA